jgi:inhibitor of cysteine peptidase
VKCTKNRYVWLWPLIVSVICACACTLPVSPRGSTAREEQEYRKGQERGRKTLINQEKEGMIILTKENDGEEHRFRAGQMFQVILPENPTTGYRWTIAEPAPSHITLIRQEYTVSHHDPLFVGGGGVRTMTFQAVSKGSTRLILLLRRSWEEEGKDMGSFHVSLYIEE